MADKSGNPTPDDNTIYVVFESRNSAAIPICWRATYDEAMAVIKALGSGMRWVMPVHETPTNMSISISEVKHG